MDANCSSIVKILVELNMDCEDCAICLDKIDNEKKKSELDCGHCFHTNCILKCASTQNSCPICRSTIFEQVDHKRQEESETIEISIIDSDNEWIQAQREVKKYDARRNRLARTNQSIYNHREKMKHAKKEFQAADKFFDLEWNAACRQLWNSEEFKTKRDHLNSKKKKWKRLESAYEKKTTEILGQRPLLPDISHDDENRSWMEVLTNAIENSESIF